MSTPFSQDSYHSYEYRPHEVPQLIAFMKVHGPGVLDTRAGRRVYQDGATSDGNPTGWLCEPDPHPIKRQLVVVRYYDILAVRARNEFVALRNQLAEAALNGKNGGDVPPPRKDTLDRLKVLVDKAKAANKEVMKARKDLDRITPQVAKQLDTHSMELSQANEDYLAELKRIDL